MIYAVIDTNVFISAALAKNPQTSIPSLVIESAFDNLYTPLFNEAIVKEYSEVLARPKLKIDKQKREILLDAFLSIGKFVFALPTEISLPDPKDIMFYDVAFANQDKEASLVTGNTKHFPNCTFAITPRDFLERLHSNFAF